jgi:hypothetical protein
VFIEFQFLFLTSTLGGTFSACELSAWEGPGIRKRFRNASTLAGTIIFIIVQFEIFVSEVSRPDGNWVRLLISDYHTVLKFWLAQSPIGLSSSTNGVGTTGNWM